MTLPGERALCVFIDFLASNSRGIATVYTIWQRGWLPATAARWSWLLVCALWDVLVGGFGIVLVGVLGGFLVRVLRSAFGTTLVGISGSVLRSVLVRVLRRFLRDILVGPPRTVFRGILVSVLVRLWHPLVRVVGSVLGDVLVGLLGRVLWGVLGDVLVALIGRVLWGVLMCALVDVLFGILFSVLRYRCRSGRSWSGV